MTLYEQQRPDGYALIEHLPDAGIPAPRRPWTLSWSRPGSPGGSERMAGRLEGKVALITGGARASARHRPALPRGARVVIGDLLESEGRVVQTIRAAGGQATFLRTDVTQEESCRALAAHAQTPSGAWTASSPAPGSCRALTRPWRTSTWRRSSGCWTSTCGAPSWPSSTPCPTSSAAERGVVLCISSGAGVKGSSHRLRHQQGRGARDGDDPPAAPGGAGFASTPSAPGDTPLKRENVADAARAPGGSSRTPSPTPPWATRTASPASWPSSPARTPSSCGAPSSPASQRSPWGPGGPVCSQAPSKQH